jgi:SAM-dependent methyltransferase
VIYDHLIGRCSLSVVDQIDELMSESRTRKVKILEIGFGTGTLTSAILGKVDSWTKGRIEYCGIDDAEDRMRAGLREHVTEKDAVSLIPGTASISGNWLPAALVKKGPFDMIIGSLVLHDIVSGEPEEKARAFFSSCKRYLRAGGKLVFADTFTSPDTDRRSWQEEGWLKAMQRSGLASKHASYFLENNRDMIDTLNVEILERICPEIGFTFDPKHVGPPWSPFHILTLEKRVVT